MPTECYKDTCPWRKPVSASTTLNNVIYKHTLLVGFLDIAPRQLKIIVRTRISIALI